MDDLILMIKTAVLAAIPVLEQKFAIPYGIGMGLSDTQAYLITLLGAVLPAPFILLFIPTILNFLRRFKWLEKTVDWYEQRTLRKGKNIAKYELLGLLLFVAIPLPLTGVWTGTAAAALLKLDFKKSLMSVLFGAAICGFIVVLVCRGAISLFWM